MKEKKTGGGFVNLNISIGNQDFESIRTQQCFYIDKTAFIKEWWENRDSVTLITRPRRFGKTLNMSMMNCFFSNAYRDRGDLFEGLSVWDEERYRNMQGTYPVIFLSFAAVKGSTYQSSRESILLLLENVYQQFRFLLQDDILTENERKYFASVGTSMTDASAAMAIYNLSDYLSRYYNKKVLLLLDEYDTPMQEAYVHGFWDEMAGFMRSIFNASFKTNPYVERAIMTGITRVSKESIFSDLNNLTVVTTTSKKYGDCFGFTEEEVFRALDAAGLGDQKQKVKEWYDGFTFGKHRDIYNPWSITNFLEEKKIRLYWANSSSNSLVSKLIQEAGPDIKISMEHLLAGEHLQTEIDEQTVFQALDDNEEAIWSLLLASGYLKVERSPEDALDENQNYELSLTNLEVEKMFRKMIQNWFRNPSARYNDFIKAMFMGDVDYMNEFMNQMTQVMFSSFDTGRHPSGKAEPERFYHGFVLGLIVDLADRYHITSNRESGFGRYDVMLEPKKKSDPAFIFEFKVYNPFRESSLEAAADNALKQINTRQYDAALRAKGIGAERIRHLGFAFEGKKVLIKERGIL